MDQEIKVNMIRRWREMAERDRETLAIWRKHDFRFRSNGIDTTEKDRADFEKRILDLEDLILRAQASDT